MHYSVQIISIFEKMTETTQLQRQMARLVQGVQALQLRLQQLEAENAELKEMANNRTFDGLLQGFESRDALAQWLDRMIQELEDRIATLNQQ